MMKEKIAETDDGSIRSMIVSKGEDYIRVGEGVAIQMNIDGMNAWKVRGGGYCNDIKTYTMNDEYNSWAWKDMEEAANNVRTFCRRKFKKEDIILFIVDSFGVMMSRGIVFLEDKICSFEDKMLEYIINYEEMTDVDFTEDSVDIKVESGEVVSLYCGDEEEYARNLFNLIMDIKDRLE